jgi:hypothetical protein
MKSKLLFTISCTTLMTASLSYGQNLGLSLQNSIFTGLGSGEVVSYAGGKLAYTDNSSGGVSLYDIGNDLSFNNLVSVDLENYSYTGFTFGSVSSVAYDGRGFGFAAIQGSTGAAGRLGVFNSAGNILGMYDVGNNPDMVKISGDRVFIANEGEFGASSVFTAAADTAGSVSYFSFSGATNAADLISNFSAETQIGFGSLSDANLDSAGIRRHDSGYAADESYKNLEPEYVAVSGDKAFVTLQENNAIAIIDLNTNTVDTVVDLGTHVVTIDGSDKNGIAIDDIVKGMVMPDSIEVVEIGGKTYVVVASEGDARGDDADIGRAKDFLDTGSGAAGDSNEDGIDDGFASNNPDGLTTDLGNSSGIGRLDILLAESDTDNDGDIDDIVTLSDRGVTIYEYVGGTLVEADHLEGIEAYLALQDPSRHNANDGGDPGEADKRSDNKGPELEALAVTEIDGKTIMAVGAERQGGIILIDITDPNSTSIFSDIYVNGYDDGLISPETMQFAEINGETFLIVGFEGIMDDGILGGIGIYAVPEPRAYAMIAGSCVLLVALMRRRVR